MPEVIYHQDFEDTYDSPGHPIPSLSVIDVWRTRRSGGADLALVIATPLQSDENSLQRLRKKLSGYLAHIQTPEFQEEAGPISPERVSIFVRIHRDSSQEAFAFLESARDWVRDAGATLVVEMRDSNAPSH